MSQRIGNTALAYIRTWHHADANERVLGKFAVRIANVLMGKHKPMYDPATDCGDYVVVTNARKIMVTGKKEQQIVYRHHTMYAGGLHEKSYRDVMRDSPDQIIRKAVAGMLPKNKLRDRRLARLRIFEGDDMGTLKANITKRYDLQHEVRPPLNPTAPSTIPPQPTTA